MLTLPLKIENGFDTHTIASPSSQMPTPVLAFNKVKPMFAF